MLSRNGYARFGAYNHYYVKEEILLSKLNPAGIRMYKALPNRLLEIQRWAMQQLGMKIAKEKNHKPERAFQFWMGIVQLFEACWITK